MHLALSLFPDLDGLDGIIPDAVAAAQGGLVGLALMIGLAVVLRRSLG